ncbi:MAG TPA: ACT domain-containing protein [Candidatus Bilamarchaeaceae archaeon]|nr:ACT domain-containing protein [Candidatus Bilamarchaeaceae archaeon]
MNKTSQLVWLYIKRRPFLKQLVFEGVVNYSSLARKICIEGFGDLKKFDAVKMALQRLSSKLSKKEEGIEEKVLQVLRKSSITIKNKVAVVISSKEIEEIKPISQVKSRHFITYIINQTELDKVKRTKSIYKIEETMNLITIESSEDIEDTPGVVSLILNSLAFEGINIVEFISCYTDTLLVVNEADTTKAYEVLNSLMSN